MEPSRPLLPLADPRLLSPRSVLLWGHEAVPEARVLAANLAAGGFRGTLSACGFAPAGFAALDAPQAADLVLLALPPPALADALRRLSGLGVRSAVVPVSFDGLARLAAETGVRCLGAGSFGIARPALGLNATLSQRPVPPGRIALVGQSAGIARAVIGWAAEEGVGFSHVIGLGANDDLGFASMLDLISRDSAAGVVLLDLRRVKLRRAFVSVARAAARTRPVAALRPGVRAQSGEAGARVLDAALRRAGVLRAGTLEGFLAAAETLGRARRHRPPPPPGTPTDRVAVLGSGTGLAFLAADAVVAGGGRLASLDSAAPALALLLPEGHPIGNPLLLPAADGARLAECAAALAALPEVDQVVVVHAPAAGEDVGVTEAALAAAAAANRGAPILVGWCGGDGGRRLSAAGAAAFATPEAAAAAALLLAEERHGRAAAAELPPRDVLDVSPDRNAVARLFRAVRAEGRLRLREDEALSVFAAYGVPVAPWRVAADPAAAAAAASAIGGRVALKVLSFDLPGKAAAGGVALDLPAGPGVAAAAESLAARVSAIAPAARLGGFLVQAMAPAGADLRLRLEEDPMFGPWIGFGAGGTAADLAGDEAVDLPPLNRALALSLVARTRAGALLSSQPERPWAGPGPVAAALVALSALAVDFPEIATASLNPLRAAAGGVLALDASVLLRPAGQAGLLAIAPYPGHLVEAWTAPDGRRLTIRPVRPEDAEAHRAFFARLPPEDVRFRFFVPMQELPPELTARLTQIDYDREMAFVAVDGDRTVGVARLVRDPGGEVGEFALVVEPAWKGQGLGRHLMQRLFAWAREVGLRAVVGRVLADNAPMLAFCRRLGFTIERRAEDPDTVEVRRQVDGT
ncbi:MAG: GNAT family N-acetyltransferase [Acetobacteraceae bacterium]|nr:GNAT family N-acetyltransferase [Acetobacteraceae bacterium]